MPATAVGRRHEGGTTVRKASDNASDPAAVAAGEGFLPWVGVGAHRDRLVARIGEQGLEGEDEAAGTGDEGGGEDRVPDRHCASAIRTATAPTSTQAGLKLTTWKPT